MRKPLILFVHGFGSTSECWSPLLELLGQDELISSRYDLRTFDYPTKWFNFNPLQRIPRLKELAVALREYIDSPEIYDRELTLVGHSQGGLVIQSYLAQLLRDGQGERLRWIRQAILMATPNRGSTLVSPLRRLLFLNPQERTLRVLNPEIHDLMAEMRERVLGAAFSGPSAWPLPVHCFYGLEDNVVVEASAKGPYVNVTPVRGDHFSILQPVDARDERCRELVEALLDPSGHPQVHEIDRYETRIQVRPALDRRSFEVTHGSRRRTVETDNVAEIDRKVRFARKNRCRSRFTIRYSTRSGGFIAPVMSHENEAPPADQGRYLDTGTEVCFQFTPTDGSWYRLKLDVYKGFDAGQRDVHFHLGRQSYYRSLRYTVDLGPYLDAGYEIVAPPELHYHHHDPEDHDLCKPRELGHALEAEREGPGVWSWDLEHVREGVVDIHWDVSEPPGDPGEPRA